MITDYAHSIECVGDDDGYVAYWTDVCTLGIELNGV